MPAADDDYQRVAAHLRNLIERGILRPGEHVPTRSELRAQFGIGDGAARDAMRVLRADGLIEGSQRRRLTVAHPPAVRTLTDPAAPWPHGIGERQLSRVVPPAIVRTLLDLTDTARLQRERVELLDPDGRTSHLLVRYTGRLRPVPDAHAVGDLSGRAAVAGEAGMLGVAIGAMLLVVPVVRFSRDGRPAVVDELLLPADRWRVRLG
ncbi:GntR family transcriptional regulator [Embleya sp. NPDC005971]|uniref:GntR family transcriptional regulator n=1 Tax=Embleya sp. NPDC005971 TaxID=3156724 RepID=UPI0033DCD58F